MSSKLKNISEKYKTLNLQEVIDYEKFCMISIFWHKTEEKEDLNIFREFIEQQYIKFLKLEIEKYKNIDKDFMLMF